MMYTDFFKLTHSPFSIAPDPRFLFMSERHREALAHLIYGINAGGGFVLLTGEIGAGKTTVCRCLLEQTPQDCNVAYIFNPKLTVDDLLQSICDEFGVDSTPGADKPSSVKAYVDALNAFLLHAHANGRHNVLIVDEAQSLSAEVLEQLRLLTNLETNERKLLQIILIGQPELRTLLEQPELSQLAQRIIARYHLESLSLSEARGYVAHRLSVAGVSADTLLPPALMKPIYRFTQGVPRRINLLCDRALLGAYAEGRQSVDRRILVKAAREVFGAKRPLPSTAWRAYAAALITGAAMAAAVAWAIAAHSRLSGGPPPAIAPARMALPSVYPGYNLDQAPRGDAGSAAHAYRNLARLWRAPPPNGDLCRLLPQSGLRCYQSDKGFADIRQLNRPAVLTLRDSADNGYYALLTAMTDTQAFLTIGDANYAVGLIALTQHVKGEFVTLWKIPPDYRDTIHLGDRGEDVDWFAAQFAKLAQLPQPEAGQPLGQDAIMRIRAFQVAQGLAADGVVGPKTYMQLSRALDNGEPRLYGGSVTVQEAHVSSGK